eukprot:756709-Hanusia_phi.AAC.6
MEIEKSRGTQMKIGVPTIGGYAGNTNGHAPDSSGSNLSHYNRQVLGEVISRKNLKACISSSGKGGCRPTKRGYVTVNEGPTKLACIHAPNGSGICWPGGKSGYNKSMQLVKRDKKHQQSSVPRSFEMLTKGCTSLT